MEMDPDVVLCTKSYTMIKEFLRSRNYLYPLDEEAYKQIIQECHDLYEKNLSENLQTESSVANEMEESTPGPSSSMETNSLEPDDEDDDDIVLGENSKTHMTLMRHWAVQRNRTALLAYIDTRLKRIQSLRWSNGADLPQSVGVNCTVSEKEYFNNYTKLLGSYMMNISSVGLDLTSKEMPPVPGKVLLYIKKEWEIDDELKDKLQKIGPGCFINVERSVAVYLIDLEVGIPCNPYDSSLPQEYQFSREQISEMIDTAAKAHRLAKKPTDEFEFFYGNKTRTPPPSSPDSSDQE